MKGISRLFLWISILIYINLFFGPLVRATDSGLACPDWPLCHGKFIPSYTFQIAMEVGHRFYSGTIGIIILLGFIKIFKNKELQELRLLVSLSLFFLGTQVALGALTVTKLLDPTTVNLHLLNAVTLLVLNFLIFAIAKKRSEDEDDGYFSYSVLLKKKNIPLVFAFILIAIQLFFGGRVSSHYAGLACPDFPTCYGEWFPDMVGTIRFQMEHRWMGYSIALAVIFSLFYAVRYQFSQSILLVLKISTNLILLQILIGALNVLYKLPKLITVIHTGIAVLLFMTFFLSLFILGWQEKKQGDPN
jgi:cytochrome c oxidase assembly protein subunit 15